MPYTISGAKQILEIAEAIEHLEFYVCKTDGKTHGFSARCSNSLNMKDSEQFAKELNNAIRPVKQAWLAKLLGEVQGSFPRAIVR